MRTPPSPFLSGAEAREEETAVRTSSPRRDDAARRVRDCRGRVRWGAVGPRRLESVSQ